MKEVQQPEISIPNDDDPLKWARYARIHSEWIRSVAPQLGLDTPKLMLGDVISSIIGDDENALWFYIPDKVIQAKNSLIERLDWEIETPELPDNFRKKLKKVRKFVSSFDWDTEEKWTQAKNAWVKVKDQIEKNTYEKKELHNAIKYELRVGEILHPYYQEFQNKAYQQTLE